MTQRAMTRGELLNLLTETATEYRKDALSSIERNRHMNNLSRQDIARLKEDQEWAQKVADAILTDFINAVGAGQCIDYGLYSKHLVSVNRT